VVAREDDSAGVALPPPLVYLAALLAGVVLHRLVVRFALPLPATARIAGAAVAAGLGVVLMAGAVGGFRRTGQNPKPWTVTPEIITTGVYRFTRNPMYVALALVQVAFAIGLANGWILVFLPVVLGIVHVTAILPEEAYLEQKFGAPYVQYKQSVRRWL